MRKLVRQVLRNRAYKNGSGHKLFKVLWKQYRGRQGKQVKEDKPVRKLAAVRRFLDKLTGGK